MGKMLQIRDIPDQLHSELRRRAKKAGKTLTDYVEEILAREVERPPREEVFERIRRRGRVRLDKPVAEYLDEVRREAS